MPPVNILIKPASSLCNMRCRYCFYADVSRHRTIPSYGIMAEDTARALVREAFAYAEGHCGFAFQGGEPTLAGLPFFKTFVSIVSALNTNKIPVQYALQTNGLAIDDDWAAFLGRNKFLVGLSMDGNAATHNALRPDADGHGTHARVQRAAATLSRYGVEYNILCVVTRDIARHGASIYAALKPHVHLQFIPCLDDLDGADSAFALDKDRYAHFLKTTFDLYYHDYMRGSYVSVRMFDNYVHMLLGRPAENCAMMGRCSCNPVIEGDGSVYPCDFYVLDRWRLGNVHDNTLADMIGGDRSFAFVQDSLAPDPACAACHWYPLCRGGCRRDRDFPGKDTLSRNRFCAAYKDFFEYAYPRLCEIASHASRQG